jgi:hypothetical protein
MNRRNPHTLADQEAIRLALTLILNGSGLPMVLQVRLSDRIR